MQTTDTAVRTRLRYMRRDDLADVLAIEVASFALPWEEQDFLWQLRNRRCVGLVAEAGADGPDFGRVVGYMIYEFDADSFLLMNLAVHPDCRRRGIGRKMIAGLQAKLTRTRRRRLTADVSEAATGAHLFLRACGLKAVKVELCATESMYSFQWEA